MNEKKDRQTANVLKKESLWFDELSTKEARDRAKAGTVIIVPIGSFEEHGEHLPLCTDSLQPEYVALEVAEKTKCLVTPPLRYGVCNSTRGFPGTISISFNSLYNITHDILEELIRNHFTRILVMSGHAGQSHMAALRLAAQEIMWKHEKDYPKNKPRIMVCSDHDFAYELKGRYFSKKDGHAGTIETSRVMAIKPELIKTKGTKSFPKMPRFEIVTDSEIFPIGRNRRSNCRFCRKRKNHKQIHYQRSRQTCKRTQVVRSSNRITLKFSKNESSEKSGSRLNQACTEFV